ncbi:MAG: carbohydrate kinase family protein [Candidatus Aenigmatarchaeota archaeon]|nr:carbohydrate kinase family protein [Candidatus Aenigmarchaeota archaeon]
MYDVTVLGDINIDIITYPLDRYPEKDKQKIVGDMLLSPGGSAFNLALACAKLGLKTKFIGKVGNDYFGNFLLEIGKKNKINMDVRKTNEKTGITFAATFKDGSRSFISFKGTNNTFSVKDFDKKSIEGKVLAVAGYNLTNSLRKDMYDLINYAKGKGMKVSLDPNWDPDGWTQERLNDLTQILPQLDWFLPDLKEAEAITFTKNDLLMIKKLTLLGCKCVLLKQGEKGCLIGLKDYAKLIPSFKIDVKNPTGAGDVFHAAFLKSVLLTNDIEKSVVFANAAGALSASKFSYDKYPTEQEIKDFLKEKNYFI